MPSGGGSTDSGWRPLAALAAVCYLPLVLTQPGWVSADTKTYLYLDPGRVLARSWSMWDPHVGLGTVTHQSIGYLWPMGPWYWAAERLGVPDWLAQRLWWATLLFVAGAGVAHLLRRFEWPAVALWPAAFVYALSPYVLTHLGRLSGVLLPFVGLPWLLAFTIEAVRRRGWRHPALFALTVATVGSVNLTALVLIGVAPLLWMLHAVLVAHEATVRQALGAALRIGLLTIPACAWWLAGLSVQASNGIDIVRYTETAQVVAEASGAQEVLRGLGYWFFYGGDQLDLWVEASADYTQQLWLLLATFAIPVLALAASAVGRWRHRAFFVALLAVGTLLAVGAHAWEGAPPLGDAIKAFLGTERGLAFRSLPRAVPLVALAVAVLVGSGIAAIAARRPRAGRPLAIGASALAVLALAPLWQGSLVGPNLRRQEVPDHWTEAAAAIDARDDGTRVLELPGIDFADYRWGATVDPITPGLVDRAYVAREHVPYGSPPSANLLNALDLGFQERTIDPDVLAPLARLLRAGDLVLRNDLQYERYNTARPRLVWDVVRDADGLLDPVPFGPTTPNEPRADRQLRDEAWLVRETGLPDPPAVALVPVSDVPPVVSTKPATGAILLAGDGTGIVDAAAAGLLYGTELVRYGATLTTEEVRAELERGAVLLVTDSNRQRGERWSTVRHTRGFTETAGHVSLAEDPTDNRLPVFPGAGPGTRTVAEHRGGITARATSYGNPIALAGELRPAMAVDGDPTTAWETGAFSDARGERLVVDLAEPLATDRLRLLQPVDSDSNRVLTEVRVHIDGGDPIEVELDESSQRAPGQLVTFPEQPVSSLEIELVADSAGDRSRFGGVGPVGFAEVPIGDGAAPVLDEVIRVPQHLLDAAGAAGTDQPLAVVLTRLRQDPTDTTRDDEERSIVRALSLPDGRSTQLRGSARLSARAPAAVLDALLGQVAPGASVSATSTLAGTLQARPAAAIDGDPATAWASEYGEPAGVALEVTLATPRPIDHLDVQVVADRRHSVPTRLTISVDGVVVATPVVEAPDGVDPGRTVTVPVDLPRTSGSVVRVEVAEARAVTSTNWDSGQPLAHPVAIAELGLPGIVVPGPTQGLDTGCRDDLLEVDGQPIGVRIAGPAASALDGEELAVEACGNVALSAGDHTLRAAPGRATGIDLDQLVLVDPGADRVLGDATDAPPAARAQVLSTAPDHLRVRVAVTDPEAPGWLILGQSHNDGWRATLDGVDLGAPELVDGFANGWRLPTGTTTGVVDLRFEPQRRVDVALAVSAVAGALCLLLALRRPARSINPRAAVPIAASSEVTLRYRGTRPSARSAVLVGIAAATLAVLVLPPLVAVAIGVVTATSARQARSRRWLVLAPPALLALAASYVVAWQAVQRVAPGLEWTADMDRAHPVAMAAVVMAVVEVLVDRLWSRGDG